MPKRPFYVLPSGDCVPLEGPWRIEQLAGEWFVLGHHSVVPCGSERAAASMLAQLEAETDPDRLAADAIAGLDRLADRWASGAAPGEGLPIEDAPETDPL